MTTSDSAADPSSAHAGKGGSSRFPVRARTGGGPRRFATAARVRFEGSVAQVFLRRLGALDFVNSIVLFGASLLLSVLPFIILLSSLANHRIDTDLSRHIGLNSQGARIVSQLFRSSPAHSAAPIVTALILAAAGTMAVAGSLQVIYERVFGQPHRGWRDVLRYLTWAGVLFGVLVTETVINEHIRAGGPVAQALVTYAGTAAFFWWTMHFLLAGRVPWRRLIHAATLTALLWIGLELVSSVYFSAAIISDSRLYGTIGVVFTLLTWFIAIGAVIVLGPWQEQHGTSAKTAPGEPQPDHRAGDMTDPARPHLQPGNSRHDHRFGGIRSQIGDAHG
jgi:membrane protein